MAMALHQSRIFRLGRGEEGCAERVFRKRAIYLTQVQGGRCPPLESAAGRIRATPWPRTVLLAGFSILLFTMLVHDDRGAFSGPNLSQVNSPF